MSDDDNERDSGGVGHENTFNLAPEWGPARLDRRHQFNGYVVSSCRTASTLRRLPLPVRPADRRDVGRDINNSRGGPDRPYSAPGVPFERNGFRNEPFKEVNFRRSGDLDSAAATRVNVTAEVFNMFNCGQHPAVGHGGHQLLRRHSPLRLRLRRANEPELPLRFSDSATGNSIRPTSLEHRAKCSWASGTILSRERPRAGARSGTGVCRCDPHTVRAHVRPKRQSRYSSLRTYSPYRALP